MQVYDPHRGDFREATEIDVWQAQAGAASYDALHKGLTEILRQQVTNNGQKVKQIRELMSEVDKARRQYIVTAAKATQSTQSVAVN